MSRTNIDDSNIMRPIWDIKLSSVRLWCVRDVRRSAVSCSGWREGPMRSE